VKSGIPRRQVLSLVKYHKDGLADLPGTIIEY
jgi:hypothetical protein